MFEYLIMIFGMNVNKRYVNHFFTGLTVAAFPATFIKIYNLRFENLGSFLIEFFAIIILFLYLISYLLITLKSNEILKLKQEMKNYRIFGYIRKSNTFSPTIIALIVWLILFTIAITFQLFKNNIGIMMANSLNEFNVIDIAKDLSIPPIIFYHESWRILIRLIYHDLNTVYSNLIDCLNIELQRKHDYSDFNLIRMIHRTVLQFIQFQTCLKWSLNYIDYYILLDTIFMAFLLSVLNIYSNNSNSNITYYLTIIYMIVLCSYSVWIKYEVNRIKNYEKLLEQYLNRWQEFVENDMCFIELKVLERTVKQFVNGSE